MPSFCLTKFDLYKSIYGIHTVIRKNLRQIVKREKEITKIEANLRK